jgi:DNA mismatch endonuclease (patch repair protein)
VVDGDTRRKYFSLPAGAPPAASSPSISKSMKANRASGTGPELVLSKLLRKRLIRNRLPGSPDFVYRKSKLAVFVHGCFWHKCPTCALPYPKSNADFWRRKFERNVERDKLNRQELEGMGWSVMEVWEHEIRDYPKAVADRVRKVGVVGRQAAHRHIP